jgi:membrane-bound lytic murein transglycosylase B
MKKIILYCATLLFFSYAHLASALDLNARPDIQNYIQSLYQQYNFDQHQLTSWFEQTDFNPHVLEKMTPHGKALSWHEYQKIFITPKRIKQGVDFWRKNSQAIHNASQQYGVPESMILGIIGVETSYGENKGSFPVFSTLATLAFDYPPRAHYFQSELTHFLLLAREARWDVINTKGSYAAALGLPQFMPSSYRIYAIDADQKGYADLMNNERDAIYSVANYLSQKGWHAGEPIATPARLINPRYATFAHMKQTASFSLKQWQNFGLIATAPISSHLTAKAVFMKNPGFHDPWLTFHNFDVLKKYNASNRYALVVYALGNQVAETAGIKS